MTIRCARAFSYELSAGNTRSYSRKPIDCSHPSHRIYKGVGPVSPVFGKFASKVPTPFSEKNLSSHGYFRKADLSVRAPEAVNCMTGGLGALKTYGTLSRQAESVNSFRDYCEAWAVVARPARISAL